MSLQYEKSVGDEPSVTPEKYLAEQRRVIRRRAFFFLGAGVLLTIYLLFKVVFNSVAFADLFQDIFFILALFGLIGGAWGIYYASKLTLEDLLPPPEAVEFLRQAQNVKPYFSYVLVAFVAVVFLCQITFGVEESITSAGFNKPKFLRRGEYWRILTGGALHGSIFHLYFNGQALYGFGSLIESLANRAHLAAVFLLSIIGGGVLSLIFTPDNTSIGASGGVMGLVGYLAIFGYRRRRQLPPDFLKTMLINIGFIAAFGVIAYQIVDNFAHLGGLLTGAVYGFAQIPRDLRENPRAVGTFAEVFGLAALGIFIFTCILSVLLVTKTIVL